MTEQQSYPFDIIRSPLAKKKYNLLWSDSDLNGGTNLEIVISSDCVDNFSDCVDSSTGVLTGGAGTLTVLGDIKLQLTEYSDYSSDIRIKEDTTFNIASDVDVKGIFIRKKSNNFILAYSIMAKPMRFCDKIIFEADNVLWTIVG